MSLTRNQFLRSVVSAAAGAAGAAWLVACGDDGGGGGADAAARSCTMNGTTVAISGNHGHVLMVSKADVVAGVSKTYDITGTAGHTHTVTISAALFTMLQNNMTVMTISMMDDHTHNITVMCA